MKLERTLPPFFGRYKMATAGAFYVTMSCAIRGYDVYKEVWNSSIGEAFMCFAEEETSHDRKAVLRPEVYIAIMQYQGVPPLPKLEVLLNFRATNVSNF